ncbi:MAG: YitT family protein [Clostridia bacterium]|nr:YitT family protein [Clostridia bacterium]
MSIFKKKNRPVKLGQAKKKLSARREIRHSLIVLLAVTLQALSILWFYRPASIVSGGVTGIDMLLNYATGGNIQSWIPMVVLNAPLLVLAYRELHLKFVIYTALSTVYFSLIFAVLENLPQPEIFDMTNPVMPLISVIFGAVLNGAFGAIVIRNGASTGGFDIVSLVLSKKVAFPMGTISMTFNMIIVAALAFFKGMEVAALSIIALFVCSVSFNNVLMGLNRNKTLFIISDKWDTFAGEVMSTVHRGITYIPARGAYTNAERKIIYILAKTVEVATIRRIVLQHDPQAIISVIDTKEVVGRGFTANN